MSTFNRLTGSARELNLELLILRIACALPFIFHGCAILFGMFGGPGPQGFAAFMHMPAIVGYLVGLAQFAGGIAILTGAFLRIGAVSVIIVMLGRHLYRPSPERLRHRPRRPRIRADRAAALPGFVARRPWQIFARQRPTRSATEVVATTVVGQFPVSVSRNLGVKTTRPFASSQQTVLFYSSLPEAASPTI